MLIDPKLVSKNTVDISTLFVAKDTNNKSGMRMNNNKGKTKISISSQIFVHGF